MGHPHSSNFGPGRDLLLEFVGFAEFFRFAVFFCAGGRLFRPVVELFLLCELFGQHAQGFGGGGVGLRLEWPGLNAWQQAGGDLEPVEHERGVLAINELQGQHADDRCDSDLNGVGVFQSRQFQGLEEVGGGLIEDLIIEAALAMTFAGGHADIEPLRAKVEGSGNDDRALAVTIVEVAEAIVSECDGAALLSVGHDVGT